MPFAFVAAAVANASSQRLSFSCSQRCAVVCTSGPSRNTTRRAFLQVGCAFLACGFLGRPASGTTENGSPSEKGAENMRRQDERPSRGKSTTDESLCKNCVGSGVVPCDLCSGTGFWRALAKNDVNQRYQGVVCPECEGAGTLTCPVCLGTGEGNVRGLLRRRRVEPGPGRILQTNM